ncbi:MAG: methylated-DNA--[protein]-cysteine S-methyltransferase [Rhodospirillales bacterium]|nr:methylated-DNA--[protein]-cysteine S-methyltransferase [Rhodospirillales bacterium]
MPHLSLQSPIGALTVFEDDGAIVSLDWGTVPDGPAPGGGETGLLRAARDQLAAYFRRELEIFDLPLAPPGSEFQRAVCRAMSGIPYGALRTYGDIAAAIGSAPRAVGGACGRNPIPVIIPCHRVVGANGAMTGYSGAGGLETKRALLHLEGVTLH